MKFPYSYWYFLNDWSSPTEHPSVVCQFVCLYRIRKWLTSFQFLLNSTQVGSRITNVSSIAQLAINVTTLWDAFGGRAFLFNIICRGLEWCLVLVLMSDMFSFPMGENPQWRDTCDYGSFAPNFRRYLFIPRILSYPSTKGWKSFEWITRKCWVISKWAVGWRGGCFGVNCNLSLFSVELLPTKLVLGGHAALPDRSQSGQRFLWPAWRNSPLRVLSALFSHRCLDLSPILRMILWILQIW